MYHKKKSGFPRFSLLLVSAHIMKTNEQIYLKPVVAFTLPNATPLPWLTDQGGVAIFMALHCVISNYKIKNFGNNVAIYNRWNLHHRITQKCASIIYAWCVVRIIATPYE